MTTYTTPELLLVGAAQNLVLDVCPKDVASSSDQINNPGLRPLALDHVSCGEEGDTKPYDEAPF